MRASVHQARTRLARLRNEQYSDPFHAVLGKLQCCITTLIVVVYCLWLIKWFWYDAKEIIWPMQKRQTATKTREWTNLLIGLLTDICSWLKSSAQIIWILMHFKYKFWVLFAFCCQAQYLKNIRGILSLTMKSQNIGSLTKTKYKQIFDSDKLDSNKWKYMSLGSFKSHTYCSIAKNGSVVVYQN